MPTQAKNVKLTDLVHDLDLSDDSKALLDPNAQPAAYCALLAERALFDDAINVLAAVLPKRGAVWWGCLCAWHASRPQPAPNDRAALEAVVRWLLDPTEEHRRACRDAARLTKKSTAAGSVAKAAFWSEGSMGPATAPHIEPPQHVVAKTVALGVQLALRAAPPDQRPQLARHFVDLGLAVAQGRHPWTGAK